MRRSLLKFLATPYPSMLFSLLVVALILKAAVTPTSEDQQLQVKLSAGLWSPYVENNDDGGSLFAIVESVAIKAGYKPKMEIMSFAQLSTELQSRQTRGGFPLVSTDDRDNSYLRTDGIMSFKYALFCKVDRCEQLTSDSTGELRLGLISGYQLWEELPMDRVVVAEYQDRQIAFEALDNEEVDVVAEGITAGYAFLSSEETLLPRADFGLINDGSGALGPIEKELYMYVPRGAWGVEFVEGFNAALREYKNSKEYRDNLAKVETGEPVYVEYIGGESDEVDCSTCGAAILSRGWTGVLTHSPTDRGEKIVVKVISGPDAGKIAKLPASSVRLLEGRTE